MGKQAEEQQKYGERVRTTECFWKAENAMLIGLHVVPPSITQVLLFSTAGVPAELLGQAQ